MFIYCSTRPWRYFLAPLFADFEPIEVSSKEFFECVGYNRSLVPMKYDENNINRQNFYLNGELIAFRFRE